MARNNAAGQERRGMTHRLIKRRERTLAGLVLFMIFTTSLLLQVSAQSCEESSEEQIKTQTTVKPHPKKRRSGCYALHLKAKSVDPGHAVVWKDQQNRSKIRLDQNDTELLIPKKGYYLINLRMTYRVPANKCPCVDNGERTLCYLTLSVMKEGSDYPEWLNVVEAKETMTCNEGSSQTINLVRVIFLTRDVKIRVKVDPKNRQLISWPSDNFFEVIRL